MSNAFCRQSLPLLCFAVLFGVVSGQNAIAQANSDEAAPSSSAESQPTQEQLSAAVATLMLCDWNEATWDPNSTSTLGSGIRYLKKLRSGDAQITGSFSALGTVFEDISVANGAAFISWSRQGSFDAVARVLRERGYVFKPASVPVAQNQDVEGLTAVTYASQMQRTLYLLPGRMMLPPDPEKSGGVTLICTSSTVSDDAYLEATGIPSVRAITRVVEKGEKRPTEWASNILNKGDLESHAALARYRWLDAEQVNRLLALKNLAGVDHNLLWNKGVSLSEAQIDSLLAQRDQGLYRDILLARYASLTPMQRDRLVADPLSAEEATLRVGDARALAILKTILQTKSLERFQYAMKFLTLSEDAVDIILGEGSDKMRASLAMESKFTYTPQQIDRMLSDHVDAVRIGVLRRKDISITYEQYLAGLNSSADDTLTFWYVSRKEHMPTPEIVERDLARGDQPRRRRWASDTRLTLTDAQVKRGLGDAILRPILIKRSDIKLTDLQMDECTWDSDVSVRFACVGRPDYVMTQRRFESIVTDENPNVFNTYIRRKQAPVDLTPFVRKTLLDMKVDVFVAAASNKEISLPDDLVRQAAELGYSSVRKAACARKPDVCSP